MTRHVPVLERELVKWLAPAESDTVLDCTLGGGGHAAAFFEAGRGRIRIIGIDADQGALDRARERLSDYQGKIIFVRENFRNLDRVLRKIGQEKVGKIVFDLGLSSDQLEGFVETGVGTGRGFSFRRDEELLMTFSDNPAKDALTARDIVNHATEESLIAIFDAYGESPHARRIARAIVEKRRESPITTSAELTRIIEDSVPQGARRARLHPATTIFQALRIAVNDEREALSEGLEKALSHLSSGGRIAVISFHSLEDRIVKRFFREKEKTGEGYALTKKPIVPTDAEKKNNPRARSAKLRIFEKF